MLASEKDTYLEIIYDEHANVHDENSGVFFPWVHIDIC